MLAITIGLGVAALYYLWLIGYFTTTTALINLILAAIFGLIALTIELWPALKAWLKRDTEETNRVKDAIAKLPPTDKQ